MTNDKKKLFERRNIWKKNRNKIIQESSWEFEKKKKKEKLATKSFDTVIIFHRLKTIFGSRCVHTCGIAKRELMNGQFGQVELR